MSHAVADAKLGALVDTAAELPHEMRKRVREAEEKAKELGRKGSKYAGECLGEVAGTVRERAADRMRSYSSESYSGGGGDPSLNARGSFRASAATASSSSSSTRNSSKHFEGRHSLPMTEYDSDDLVDLGHGYVSQGAFTRRENDGKLVDPRTGRELSLLKMDRHTLNDWYAIMHDFMCWRNVLNGADGCCI